MPREWSEELQEIHKAYKRRDTLDVYLADGSVLNLSRGKVIREIDEELVEYQNWIRSVGDMYRSIEQSIDRIRVKCQNVNSELGFNLASNLRLLDYAVADYGKVYQSIRDESLIEDIPIVFPGVLANAEVDEQNFDFELIADIESLGSIIASRGLSAPCWWTYKNGIECTSTSGESSCPKTRAACLKRHDPDDEKEAEFGGWEFFEDPTNTPPGSGGNPGGGFGGCFTGETLIWTPDGNIPIGELKARAEKGKRSIYSFDPKTGEIIEDEIEAFWSRSRTGFYTLGFEHSSVNVTALHRFLIRFGEFSKADNFRRGDTTKAFAENNWLDSQLQKIKWNSDKTEVVNNLRVKKNRSYFANGCAVSNSKDTPVDG